MVKKTMNNINNSNTFESNTPKKELNFFKDVVCLGYIAMIALSGGILTYSCCQSHKSQPKHIQKQEIKIKQQNERIK